MQGQGLLHRIIINCSQQGQRHRKLEARTIREQKEEEEKKLIDLEEAQYQAQQRREAIEKAKTQQYYQTDRVKQFHVSSLGIQDCNITF